MEYMFGIGETVIHPLHGAGVISEIRTQRVDRQEREYYVFTVPGSSVTVLVPVDAEKACMLRPVMSREEASAILASFEDTTEESGGNWNRRYRENVERLKSGNARETAQVLRGLLLRQQRRSLSAGELRMLEMAQQVLYSELGLALSLTTEEVAQLVREKLQIGI